jgi:hypothetical protein
MRRMCFPLVVLLAMIACASPSTPSASPEVSMTASIPDLGLGHMHVTDGTDTGEQASLDATDPQAMQTILGDAGLVGVRERVYTGGRGSYSRVVVRAWQFASANGAGAFSTWLVANATHGVIGEAKPALVLPGLFVHQPSGCCHEETPVYLATWKKGDLVWTVVASGPRIQTPPVVQLVRKIQQEV